MESAKMTAGFLIPLIGIDIVFINLIQFQRRCNIFGRYFANENLLQQPFLERIVEYKHFFCLAEFDVDIPIIFGYPIDNAFA